jgi:hypothetical protein
VGGDRKNEEEMYTTMRKGYHSSSSVNKQKCDLQTYKQLVCCCTLVFILSITLRKNVYNDKK